MIRHDVTTAARIAENQSLFREANEKIESGAEAMHFHHDVPFICECADTRCTAIVRLDLHEYENVREHARRFFVIPEHADIAKDADAAVVVANHADYTVLDKIGVAGKIAEQRYDELP